METRYYLKANFNERLKWRKVEFDIQQNKRHGECGYVKKAAWYEPSMRVEKRPGSKQKSIRLNKNSFIKHLNVEIAAYNALQADPDKQLPKLKPTRWTWFGGSSSTKIQSTYQKIATHVKAKNHMLYRIQEDLITSKEIENSYLFKDSDVLKAYQKHNWHA